MFRGTQHDNRIEISDQYVASPNLLNNFHMALGTNYQQTQSVTTASSVIAAGAFAEGGA
jgi:hypothetical protein